MYYKIIQSGNIVGAGFQFLKWFPRSRKFAFCDLEQAQCVKDAVTDELYHADWLKNVPQEASFTPSEAEVVFIELAEYDDIIEELMDGEPIPEPEQAPIPEPTPTPEPEPEQESERMTVAEMREKIAELTELVQDLADQNTLLSECIMEMSEIVYA